MFIMEETKKKLLSFLFKLDGFLHIVIAFSLIILAFITVGKAILNFSGVDHSSILQAVNDLLLALIIAEILWPVLKFLKKEEFSLNPFLFVGIISATRRLLFIEATQSTAEGHSYHHLIEMASNVGVIFVLTIVYFIYSKASQKKE